MIVQQNPTYKSKKFIKSQTKAFTKNGMCYKLVRGHTHTHTHTHTHNNTMHVNIFCSINDILYRFIFQRKVKKVENLHLDHSYGEEVSNTRTHTNPKKHEGGQTYL